MRIRLRSSGEVVGDGEFRARNATTSFPVELTRELLAAFDADPVIETAQPPTTEGQYAAFVGVEDVNGEWFTIYEARDLPPDQANRRVMERRRHSVISDRQFFQQAAVIGIISHSEALAAVKMGVLPTVLQNIVDAEPDPDKRFAMEMLLSGATTFERTHPLTEPLGAALGLTVEEVDQFFRDAAML